MEHTDKQIEAIAQACHSVNKAYCEAKGDLSQPCWAKAPDWQRASAIKGVRYHLANPDSKAGDSHLSWMKEKQESGWVWGPVKDPEKKQHPDMVPFEHLPKREQMKDFLFIITCRSMFLAIQESLDLLGGK